MHSPNDVFSCVIIGERKKVLGIRCFRTELQLSLKAAKEFFDWLEKSVDERTVEKAFNAVYSLKGEVSEEVFAAFLLADSTIDQLRDFGYKITVIRSSHRFEEVEKLFHQRIKEKVEEKNYGDARSLMYFLEELEKTW